MGIKCLNRLIEIFSKNSIHKVSLEKYAGKRIAIDGNSYIHCVMDGCFDRINSQKGPVDRKAMYYEYLEESTKKLIDTGIKPIFFFDGSFPKEKIPKLKERKEERKNERNILKHINQEQAIEKEILEPFIYKKFRKNIIKSMKSRKIISLNSDKVQSGSTQPSLIEEETVELNYTDNLLFHTEILRSIVRYIPLLCDFLKSFNVPSYQREGEAERNISLCVNNGLADAVMSNDNDCLTFGSSLYLYKIDKFLKNDIIFEIELENLLKNLKLTYPEFVDLCILLGCEYSDILMDLNDARNYIYKYHSLENIHSNCSEILSFDQLNRAIYARSIFYRGCIKSDIINKNLLDSKYFISKLTYVETNKPDYDTKEKIYEFNNSIIEAMEISCQEQKKPEEKEIYIMHKIIELEKAQQKIFEKLDQIDKEIREIKRNCEIIKLDDPKEIPVNSKLTSKSVLKKREYKTQSKLLSNSETKETNEKTSKLLNKLEKFLEKEVKKK